MTTILYPIPESFFPGYRVTHSFQAKVKYTFKDDNVIIHSIELADTCLEYIKPKGLAARMKKDIAEAERKKTNGQLHPIFQQALTPFITQ